MIYIPLPFRRRKRFLANRARFMIYIFVKKGDVDHKMLISMVKLVIYIDLFLFWFVLKRATPTHTRKKQQITVFSVFCSLVSWQGFGQREAKQRKTKITFLITGLLYFSLSFFLCYFFFCFSSLLYFSFSHSMLSFLPCWKQERKQGRTRRDTEKNKKERKAKERRRRREGEQHKRNKTNKKGRNIKRKMPKMDVDHKCKLSKLI